MDWYYPECSAAEKYDQIIHPKLNYFEPKNLLYEDDDIKLLRLDEYIHGKIINVFTNEDLLKIIVIETPNKRGVYCECIEHLFNQPDINCHVKLLYDVVNDVEYNIITSII